MAVSLEFKLDKELRAQLAGVEALIFDLDDVLFEKGEWIMHSLEYAADCMGLDGQQAWALAAELREERGRVDHDIYNHVLLGLGQSDSGRNIKALCSLAGEYRPLRGQIKLYSGVGPALEELKANYKMGLVTDGPVLCQQAKVQALGLKDYFSYILYSDSIAGVASRKPDPRPFESMWLTLKSRKERVLVIGSNPRKDFEARKKQGFLTLRVLSGELANNDYPDEQSRAHYCISTLSQLPSLLESARTEQAEQAEREDTSLRIA